MSSLFTKIRQGELPGHLLWDDGRCFAILTIKPIREGHLLVIPHQEVDHWDDMDETPIAVDYESPISRTVEDAVCSKLLTIRDVSGFTDCFIRSFRGAES